MIFKIIKDTFDEEDFRYIFNNSSAFSDVNNNIQLMYMNKKILLNILNFKFSYEVCDYINSKMKEIRYNNKLDKLIDSL